MPDEFNFERAQYSPEPYQPVAEASLARAVLYGAGAAVGASLLYAAFTIATHIQFGIAAVAVGYMVGKALIVGANGRGGRNLQIASAVLTYLAVSLASVPELLWTLHQRGASTGILTPRVLLILARYGVTSPFMGLTNGISGLLGLFILFIGIRAAWRLTSDNANTSHHPFAAS